MSCWKPVWRILYDGISINIFLMHFLIKVTNNFIRINVIDESLNWLIVMLKCRLYRKFLGFQRKKSRCLGSLRCRSIKTRQGHQTPYLLLVRISRRLREIVKLVQDLDPVLSIPDKDLDSYQTYNRTKFVKILMYV